MSKTVSTCICETNLVKDQPQENVFFLTLSRKIEDFPNEFLRTARSTSPIQICAIFSTIGPDNLGAILNIELNKELEKIVADFSNQTILDFEAFSNRVVNTLNIYVCNFSANKGVALKTSMTMLIIEGDILRVIHLGITKAVLFRDSQILALTEEQTVARRYVKMGAISAEDEKTHPENMNLTQYLGKMPQDGQLTPDKNVNIKLKDGDELFLMGLGVSRKMPAQLRNSAVIKRIPIEDKVKEIMNSAINYGIKSGLTLIGMQVESTFILPGEAVIHTNLASDATVAPVQEPKPADEFIDFSKPEQSQPKKERSQSSVNDDTKPMPKSAAQKIREIEEEDEDDEEYPVKASRGKSRRNKREDSGTKKFVPGGAEYDDGSEEQYIGNEDFSAPTSNKQKAMSVLIPILILIVCILLGFGITFLVFHVRDLLDSNGTQATTTETSNQVLYVTSDQTPVYSQAKLDSTIIEKLDRGSTVTLVGVEDKFSIVITSNNITGYILTAQLSEEDPTYNDETSEMSEDPTPTPTEETTESSEETTTTTTEETTTKATTKATTTTTTTEDTTTTTTTKDTTTTTTTKATSDTTTTTTTADTTTTTTTTASTSEDTTPSSSETPADTTKNTEKPADTSAPDTPADNGGAAEA